jgi:ElaB/YqjD/DUF883 family membrane-anchored ribosome-binding protein
MAMFTFVLAATSWLTIWILKNQLREMHEGGIDTHDLAVAAGKQADAAKVQSEQAKAQTDKMAESLTKTDKLINKATEQANATNRLAMQAKRSADVAQEAIQLATKDSVQNAERIERQLTILQDQARAARDQADAALKSAIAIQKQTEISERPWLSVDVATVNGLIWVNGQQAALTLKLSIKNVGKSIAKGIQANAKLVPTAAGMPISANAAQAQRELCDHFGTDQVGAFDLFPADHPTERQLSISAVPSAIATQSVTIQGDKAPRTFVGFDVVGCVSYHSSFGREVHQTRFAYRLIGPQVTSPDGKFLIMPDGMPVIMDFEIGVAVPQDNVGLIQELLGSNYAN